MLLERFIRTEMENRTKSTCINATANWDKQLLNSNCSCFEFSLHNFFNDHKLPYFKRKLKISTVDECKLN